MKDRVVCRIEAALAVASVLVLTQSSAHAQQRSEGAARETLTEVRQENEAPRPEDEESIREPLYLGIDFMLGFGNYTTANEKLPQPPDFLPGYTRVDDTQVRTATFMALGHYRFKKFGLGVRFPLISGHIASEPAANTVSQDIFTIGNLEFSFDMPRKLSKEVRYVPSIALTLPTSPGNTTPYTDQAIAAQMAGKSVNDQATLGDGYARYAVSQAAAFARGGEEDALFFNWRLGITPKIGFDLKFNHTLLQPYVKVPIMFALEQSSAAEEPVRIEVVGGVRLLQEIGPVGLGVRLVGMIPIAARTSLRTPMLSVWPEVRLQLTPSAQFWISGMIPLAGDFNVFDSGKNGAFNAGLSATF